MFFLISEMLIYKNEQKGSREMAIIKQLLGSDTLKVMYPKVNENFENLNNESADLQLQITENNQDRIDDLEAHKTSTDHPAQNITYSGKINKPNVKEALDDTKDRIDNIVTSAGTSNTEIVDARQSTVKSKTFANVRARFEESENQVKALENQVYQSQSNSTTLTTLELLKSVTDSYASPAKLTLGGATLYNAVVNGDFSNGTAGWQRLSSTSINVDSSYVDSTKSVFGANSIRIFANNETRTIVQELNFPINTKVFVKGFVRKQSGTGVLFYTLPKGAISGPISVLMSETQFDNLPIGVWTPFYAISTTTNDGIKIAAGRSADKSYDVNFDGIFAIPITGTPYENYTADQMNALVNTYFEGLKSCNKMEILTRGRNLFDEVLELGYLNNTSGASESSTTALRSKNFIKIKPNTLYTLSNNMGYLNRLYWYGKDFNFISLSPSPATSPANATYVKFRTEAGLVQNNLSVKFMLNEGSTALPYAPYVESKAKITCTDETKFTLAKLNSGIKNEILINDGKWRAIKRVERYVLQSADIDLLNTSGVNFDYVSIKKTSLINSKTWVNAVVSNEVIVSGFGKEVATPIPDTTESHYKITTIIDKLLLIVPKGTYASLSAAQTALAGTVIYYELATPITIEEKDLSSYGIQVEGLLATNNAYTEFIVNDYDMLGDVGVEYSINLAKAIEELKDGQITEREFRVRQNLINLEFDARIKLLETPTP